MQANSQPLISVIVNCFNGEQYIAKAIQSVIDQTYCNFEIIVWDNCSTDRSAEIVQSIHDQRIRYFKGENHVKLYHARCFAIEKAVGDYYAFLDVDDIWLPTKLEKQIIKFAESNVGVVYSNFGRINEAGKVTLPIVFRGELPCGEITQKLLNRYVVGLLTIVVSKEAYLSVGGFDPKYMMIGDFDLILRISKKWRIIAIQCTLALYRTHEQSLSYSKRIETSRELSRWMRGEKAASSLDAKLFKYDGVEKEIRAVIRAQIIENLRKFDLCKLFTIKKNFGDRDVVNKESGPLVSIIIPVFNGSKFLGEAIDSALNQTYKNIEIIVVNDGSDDNGYTEYIAKSYGDKIRYFSKTNGGCGSALNFGISQMQGEYFSWLSHDDVYMPDKIRMQLRALRHKREIILGPYNIIDGDSLLINRVKPHLIYSIKNLNKPLFALFKGAVHGCSLLIHRDLFCKHGVFNESLLHTQDYDLWFRLMRNESIQYLPRILINSRAHDQQGSKSGGQDLLLECNALWINFMRQITLEEIHNISDSPLDFFGGIRDLMDASNFVQARDYADHELRKLELREGINYRPPSINIGKIALIFWDKFIFDKYRSFPAVIKNLHGLYRKHGLNYLYTKLKKQIRAIR